MYHCSTAHTHTQHTVRSLKSAVSELEGAVGVSRAETATARRQADAAAREVAAARAARQQMEAGLRQQVAAVRAERDAEVRRGREAGRKAGLGGGCVQALRCGAGRGRVGERGGTTHSGGGQCHALHVA